MKNMLYVTNIPEDANDGVWNKIKYNIMAYQRLGFKVDFAYKKSDGYYVIESGYNSSENNIERIDCLHKDIYFYSLTHSLTKEYDVVYIRKPTGGFGSLFLVFLLKKLKKNKNCCVVFEIPTYPYAKEIKNINFKVSEWILGVSRLFFIRYVDLITYMGDEVDQIWGRPSLRLANAIDLDHVGLAHKELKLLTQKFTFVGVARLSFWHGYDRLIKAISEYMGDYEVSFLIIGNGEPEMTRLKKIAREFEVGNKVTFLGSKNGDDLDLLYKKSYVCVDSLGRHRSGALCNSSLKSKEYTAKGIPFVKSHIDDSFLGANFVFDVTPDESAIDISAIIYWYSSLPNNTPVEMRRYADAHLSWDKQCEKVMSKLSDLREIKS